ncbi:MAG: NUDIX hydrolase [Candidatus Pacebacteria bacterium]|nr:NUDIX hydrolase [Candidatus Paceibacterota bacterium]
MELQVGVKILLRNKAGKCLLVRRSLDKYPDASGSWDIAGGRIEPGTALIDNLKREVKEETSLDLDSTEEIRLIGAQDILRVPGKHVVRLTYTGLAAEGEVELDKEENIEFRWLSIDEIKEMPDLCVYLKELLDKGGL